MSKNPVHHFFSLLPYRQSESLSLIGYVKLRYAKIYPIFWIAQLIQEHRHVSFRMSKRTLHERLVRIFPIFLTKQLKAVELVCLP